MAKKADIDLNKLCWSIHRARLALRYPREERTHAVRQMTGSHWSEEGSKERVPLNMLSLYVGVVGRSLIAKAPRVMLSTFLRQHKPVVSAMQSWMNKRIAQINLAETLQRVVLDGLFSVGVCKVALAAPADSARMAWNLGAGQPFAERVDLDDFVFDIHARSFQEVGFIGHRIRVPYDAIKDSKLYNRTRKDLTPANDQPFNKEGDERISMLGRTYYAADDQEFEEHVDLWEIYLPRHRLVYTLADESLVGASPMSAGSRVEPLRVQNWVGPDCGPYHILGYRTVPGNIMPKGPVQDLVDLHEFINQTYRKLMRQTARQKTVTFARRGSGTEDASRVLNANDGEIVGVDDPSSVNEVVMGGPNQQLMAVFIDAIQRFSYMAGNLDMMGGLSPQAKTLGQDKMLEENASQTITDMQDRTVIYAGNVLNALGWFWHHHPFEVMQAEHSLPGLPEMSLQRQVPPQQRQQVKFEDLEVKVCPYSMQQQTPKQVMAAIDQMVQQTIMPMMQLLQSQGVVFDINAYLKKKAEYLELPDLSDIVTIQEPPPQAGGESGGGGAPGMPQETTRNYNRVSQPGRTQKGDDMNKVSTLMGVNPGGAQESKNGVAP